MATKNSKTHKTADKSDDAAHTRSAGAAPAPQILDVSAHKLSGYMQPQEATAKPDVEPAAPPAKRIVIKPLSEEDDLETSPEVTPENESVKDEADSTPATEETAVSDPSEPAEEEKPEPAAKAPSPQPAPADEADSEEEMTTAEAAKLQKDTEKAAEEAAKRKQELQEYMESQQFFVPIDAVARKRSVKVSIGLTFLVLLMAVALIDLMLDSGTILLLQKIPHTHFFGLGG